MTSRENPFSNVFDPIDLTPDERERYYSYWASRPLEECWTETSRLNRAKWGEDYYELRMDKSKIEIVDMDTGQVRRVIYNSKA